MQDYAFLYAILILLTIAIRGWFYLIAAVTDQSLFTEKDKLVFNNIKHHYNLANKKTRLKLRIGFAVVVVISICITPVFWVTTAPYLCYKRCVAS